MVQENICAHDSALWSLSIAMLHKYNSIDARFAALRMLGMAKRLIWLVSIENNILDMCFTY